MSSIEISAGSLFKSHILFVTGAGVIEDEEDELDDGMDGDEGVDVKREEGDDEDKDEEDDEERVRFVRVDIFFCGFFFFLSLF